MPVDDKKLDEVINCLNSLSRTLDSTLEKGDHIVESIDIRKDSEMPAVENDNKNDKRDSEEKKDSEERKDGNSLESAKTFEPDNMLCYLDAFVKRLDAMSSRMDAMSDKFEEAMKDKKSKKDDDTKLATDGEAESAMNAQIRRDAEEEKEEKKDRKDRKDGESSEGLKKWAEEESKEKEHKDSRRKDAQIDSLLDAVKSQQATIAKLQKQMSPVSDADYHKLSAAHHRADAIYSAFNDTAPRPFGSGESLVEYEKRLVLPFKKYHATWKDVDINTLPDNAFHIAKDQIYEAAKDASMSPADLEFGQFRAIPEVNPITGARSTRFVGKGTIFGAMKPAMMRVEKWHTPNRGGNS